MKKLRMFVTSVIVLAIVGSAFAFNAKKLATFCVDTQSPFTNCDATTANKKIDPIGGSTIHYYANWDGAAATCTGNNCTSTVKVVANP
jgi:hypothetical protein